MAALRLNNLKRQTRLLVVIAALFFICGGTSTTTLALSDNVGTKPSAPLSVPSETLRGGYALSSSCIPRPGSTYHCSMKLPFLGVQSFQLSVRGENKRHLSIGGGMSVDATIDHNVCSTTGAVSFLLPESVIKILRKFRTKLVEARYNPESDSVLIKVLSPIQRHVQIELSRQ